MSVQHVVKPYLLAAQGTTLELEFALAGMNRLKDMLSGNDGKLEAKFDFNVSDFGSKVRVRAKPKLKVLCQRCRTEMPIQLLIDSQIILTRSEEELAKLPDEADVMVVENEMSLKDLMEDELILAMPILSRHESDQCPVKQYNSDNRPEGTYRPFANLKDKWSN